eukprot:GILI01082667.1.p1 GENE.GILI01082667.1~~GILI01082667.1.p1  ORF type:complete len:101 (+),score=7.72 GILI01082667.1:173-475(+)
MILAIIGELVEDSPGRPSSEQTDGRPHSSGRTAWAVNPVAPVGSFADLRPKASVLNRWTSVDPSRAVHATSGTYLLSPLPSTGAVVSSARNNLRRRVFAA